MLEHAKSVIFENMIALIRDMTPPKEITKRMDAFIENKSEFTRHQEELKQYVRDFLSETLRKEEEK